MAAAGGPGLTVQVIWPGLAVSAGSASTSTGAAVAARLERDRLCLKSSEVTVTVCDYRDTQAALNGMLKLKCIIVSALEVQAMYL